MPRDQVLMSDYSNRLSGAVSLRDPSLKHSLLENHLDLYLINFVYFSNALGRLHTEMCFSDCFACEPSLSKAVLSSIHGEHQLYSGTLRRTQQHSLYLISIAYFVNNP